MAQALELEKVDEHGKPDKRYAVGTSRQHQKAKRPRIDASATVVLSSSDEGDHDFEGPEGSDSDSESDSYSVDMLPSNAEVSHLVNLLLGLNHGLFMLGCRSSPFQDHSLHRAWSLCKTQALKAYRHR